MHQHLLFEDVSGRPIPRTRRGRDGTDRQPDGARFFDLDGAVAHFNMTRQALVSLWDDAYADLPWARSPVVGTDGVPADDAAAPTAMPEGSDRPMPRDNSAIGALRRVHYGHLSDDDFVLFLEECRRRGFDPFCKQVVARKETDWRSGEEKVSIITTIGAFTLIAQRTGEWEGLTPPQWAGPDLVWKELWPDDVLPYAARQGVFRKGFREPVWGTVFWKERAPYMPVAPEKAGADGPVIELDPFWQQMPRGQLAKCARADAFRQAFGEELAGVYTFDEMGRAEATKRRGADPTKGGGAAVSPSAAPASDDYAIPSGRRFEPDRSAILDDAIPNDDEEFAEALKPLGFDDAGVRAKVIRLMHGHFAALFNVNETAAYAKALDMIRRNPEHYGARVGRRRVPA